jgi:hypothetical protein
VSEPHHHSDRPRCLRFTIVGKVDFGNDTRGRNSTDRAAARGADTAGKGEPQRAVRAAEEGVTGVGSITDVSNRREC